MGFLVMPVRDGLAGEPGGASRNEWQVPVRDTLQFHTALLEFVRVI
ncbi:hypothetical protein PQR18_41745 [Paraburkholderia sediminicola]